MNQRFLAVLWGGVILLLGILLAIQFYHGVSLETDVMELLPGEEQAPEIGVLLEMFQGNLGRTMILHVKAPDEENRHRLRDMIKTILAENNIVKDVHALMDRSRARSFYDFYFPRRYQFLAPEIRNKLDHSASVKWFTERIQRRLHGVTFSFDANIIERDPLLLFPALMNQWVNRLPNKRTETPQETSVTLLASLNGNPFKPRVQHRVNELMKLIEQRVDSNSGNFEWTGVVKFAHQSRSSMLGEMTFISTISMAGIVLLIVFSFRTIHHLLQLFVSIATGFVTAMSVSLLWFPDLHLVTVTFGASLIGVCVDYSFHYFVEAARSKSNTLVHVFPGILLGLLTTVIAYAALSFTPFPALRQMALFSSLGLIGAFLSVVCWYPLLEENGKEPGDRKYIRFICGAILDGWRWFHRNRLPLVLLVLTVVGVIGFGVNQLTFTDDIKKLGNIPEQSIQQDRALRSRSGFVDTGRYLMVRGNQPQQLLARENQVTTRLRQFRQEGYLDHYYGLSMFVPTRQQQNNDRQRLATYLNQHRESLISQLGRLGYSQNITDNLFNSVRSPIEQYITIESWLEHAVSVGFRTMWLGKHNQTYGSVVVLENISNETKLRSLAQDLKGVFYHNRVATFRKLLRKYRREAMGLITIAYCLIGLVLIGRYGLVRGTMSILPAIIGTLLTAAVLTMLGHKIHIMHIVSFLLILGMGVDYGIFLTEGVMTERKITSVFTAIFLSAVSTTLSFGLLALSENPVLNAIGSTVFVGMVCMLLLAPLPLLLSDQ